MSDVGMHVIKTVYYVCTFYKIDGIVGAIYPLYNLRNLVNLVNWVDP